MNAIVTFRVPRYVRGEARPSSHTAKTYNTHVGCAHVNIPYMLTVLMAGRSLDRSTGLVWSLCRALEALQTRSSGERRGDV
jgi:hypothetical protein